MGGGVSEGGVAMRTQRGKRAWAIALGFTMSGLIAMVGPAERAQAGPAPVATETFEEQPIPETGLIVPDGICFAEIRAVGDSGAPLAADRTSGFGGQGAAVSVKVPLNSGDVVTALTMPGGAAGLDERLPAQDGGNAGGDGHGVQVTGGTYTSYVVAGGGGGGGDGVSATDRSKANGGDAGVPTALGETPGENGQDGASINTQAPKAGGGGQGGWSGGGSGGSASGAAPVNGAPPPTDGLPGHAFPDGAGGAGGNSASGAPGGFPGGGGGGGWTGGGGGGGSILIGNSDSGAGGGGSSYVSDWWGGITNDLRDEVFLGNTPPSNGWDSSIRFETCGYDLGVTKTLANTEPLVAGGIAEYDITVTNFGPNPMAMQGDTVLIADEDLSKIDPFVTEFLPIDPLADVTYTFDPVGGAVYGGGYGLPDNGTRCSGNDIVAGLTCAPLGVGDSYTVRVRQGISNFHPNNISHCNAASIDGDRPVEPETKPDSTTEVCAPVGAYNLETQKTVDPLTLAGADAVWRITVTNHGPADMAGPADSDNAGHAGWYSLTITDPLLVGATSVGLPDGCANNGDGTLTCPPLTAGSSYDITVTTPTDVAADAGTLVSNNACSGTKAFYDWWGALGDTDLVNDVDLTADGAYDVNGDHKPDNVDTNACADTQTELVPGDLGIEISTAPSFVVGEPITWTIVVKNHTGLPYTLPQSVVNPTLASMGGTTVSMPDGCTEAATGEWLCSNPLGIDESMTFTVTTPTGGGAPAALMAADADGSTSVESCAQVADSAVDPEAPDEDCATTVARPIIRESTTTTSTTLPDPPPTSETTAPAETTTTAGEVTTTAVGETTTTSSRETTTTAVGETTTTSGSGTTTTLAPAANVDDETTTTTTEGGGASEPDLSIPQAKTVEVLGASTVAPTTEVASASKTVIKGSTQVRNPSSRTGTNVTMLLGAAIILLAAGLTVIAINRRRTE